MATPTERELFAEGEPELPAELTASSHRSLIEWLVVVAGAVIVALVVKTFVMQAFFIPSESMTPTLLVGDRVLVNKLSYKLHDINYGDIVVFERPPSEDKEDIKDLIKRVVGRGGDTIVFRDERVYRNGEMLRETYLPADTPTTPGPGGSTWTHRCTTDDPCKIPDDSVWVMGDNRTNSKDSRWLGPIPKDLIVGRAFVTVWPLSRFGGI